MLMDCIKTHQMSKRAKDNYNAQFFGEETETESKTYCEMCCETEAEITQTLKSSQNESTWEENLCFHCRNKSIKHEFGGLKNYREENRIVGVKLISK